MLHTATVNNERGKHKQRKYIHNNKIQSSVLPQESLKKMILSGIQENGKLEGFHLI